MPGCSELHNSRFVNRYGVITSPYNNQDGPSPVSLCKFKSWQKIKVPKRAQDQVVQQKEEYVTSLQIEIERFLILEGSKYGASLRLNPPNTGGIFMTVHVIWILLIFLQPVEMLQIQGKPQCPGSLCSFSLVISFFCKYVFTITFSVFDFSPSWWKRNKWFAADIVELPPLVAG